MLLSCHSRTISKFCVTSRLRGCFRASTSNHPRKDLARKPNWSLISDNGSLSLRKLRPRGSEVVRKCNVEIISLGRLGRVNEARKLFDEMAHRDDVSYNSMITVYLKNNDLSSAELLFKAMPERNTVAESAMIDGYVKAGRLDDARDVFDSMTEKNEFSWTSLISGYFKSGKVEEGRRIFDQIPVKNVVSWTTTVLGYARNGFLNEARKFFDLMPEKNIIAWTVMIKSYLEHDHFFEAAKLFHEMPQRNMYSWNIMISGCLSSNRVNEAIQLFDSMPQRSSISWTIMVSGLARNKMIDSARKYFDQMPNKDIAAWNAMIAAYLMKGLMDEAHELFILMPEKNIVTWNTLIDGYTRTCDEGSALKYFVLMLRSGFRPDKATMTSVVISSNGMLELMQAHAQVIHLGFEQDTSLTNALINMYSKSGDLRAAWLAFEQLKLKDAVSWTSMIVAYSNHGHGYHALQAFACMLRSGATPDAITFLGLLSACSHTGLVNKGRRLFDSMRDAYNLKAKAEHYACLVDIVGRAGLLNEAIDIVVKMPPSERDGVVLGALLGACKLRGDAKTANSIGEKLLELDPSSSGGYALLANAYAAEGKWDEFAQVKKKMRERSVKRRPGYSLIEVRGKNHVFVVGDRSHPQIEEIYGLLLQNLQPLMREMVYTQENPLLLE
ncbi:pentatricopeptide repeat-containing protein At4g02750-like [Neltuma alba]|uniref:pentatricopeptide repeat-containing protein At4g02750-like n=1 Tax=Neltuma alba TaxID=207710 RepID=UPI0010A54FBF|nr:pentatricopeptide repeat-containing protein At4g02750-like [Prosopis alba]